MVYLAVTGSHLLVTLQLLASYSVATDSYSPLGSHSTIRLFRTLLLAFGDALKSKINLNPDSELLKSFDY